MPERNTGPVKPPVIDLTPASGPTETGAPPKQAEMPDQSEAPKQAETPETEGVKREPETAAAAAERQQKPAPFPWAPVAASVIGGAVLGTALTYALLSYGYMPLPQAGDNTRLAALEKQVADLSESDRSVLAGLGDQLGDLEGQVAGKAASADLDAIKQQLANVQGGATSSTDIAGLEADVTSLAQRLDALGNGGTTPDPGTTQKLAELGQRLDSLAADLAAVKSGNQAALDSLRTELADASNDSQAQLPLLLTSLETAFNAGQPFDMALTGIRQVAPDADVPDRLSGLAQTGLVAPEKLNADFAAALPAMLAAIPGDPSAGWQGAAVDWLKAQLALRPAGDTASTSPDAVLARIETALAARNYIEADRLFASLPEPVRAAAGDLPNAIAAHADAQHLLDSLRQRALAPLTGARP